MRTHDVVLFDGTFRIVLTPRGRVVAVMNAPETPLGPMHVALNIDRHGRSQGHIETAGIFDDIGHAAESTFNSVTHLATPLARPAFDVMRGATAQAAHLIANATPLLPPNIRDQIDRASQVLMKARLGDLNAKNFIRTVASAAKSGVSAAQHVGDTLLDASKFIAKAVDGPLLMAAAPGMGALLAPISPLKHYEQLVTALQKGDFRELKKMLDHDVSFLQGAASIIPGLGTGVSSALGAGLAALENGNPLEFAVRTAYGAIPIPNSIRQLTDIALDTVMAFVANPHSLTDVALQVARDRVPVGMPREVFDTLVQLVVKRVPIQKAGAAIVDHYVQQYAPAFSPENLSRVMQSTRMVQPLMHA